MRLDSNRFGALEVEDARLVDFPLGLAGLKGRHWALVESAPAGGTLWLHSVENASLALPIIDPRLSFPDFALMVAREELDHLGLAAAEAAVYATVRVVPGGLAANLKAPLLILRGCGYQVTNLHPAASLRAALPAPASPPGGASGSGD